MEPLQRTSTTFGPSSHYSKMALHPTRRIVALLDEKRCLTVLTLSSYINGGYLEDPDRILFQESLCDEKIYSLGWTENCLLAIGASNQLWLWSLKPEGVGLLDPKEVTHLSVSAVSQLVNFSAIFHVALSETHFDCLFAMSEAHELVLILVNSAQGHRVSTQNVGVFQDEPPNNGPYEVLMLTGAAAVDGSTVSVLLHTDWHSWRVVQATLSVSSVATLDNNSPDNVEVDHYEDSLVYHRRPLSAPLRSIDLTRERGCVAVDSGHYEWFELRGSLYCPTTPEIAMPYGPFPCQSIDKIRCGKMKGFRGPVTVFTGGLPLVRYAFVHSITVCISDEPELCFTFQDPVVTFELMPHPDNIESILVLTQSQLVVLTFKESKWQDLIVWSASPISYNSHLVTQVTEIIQTMNSDAASLTTSGNMSIKSQMIFGTIQDNGIVSIWSYIQDCFFRIAQFDFLNYLEWYKTYPVAPMTNESPVLWPPFHKSGMWWEPTITSETVVLDIDLVQSATDLILKVLTTNGCIFRFRVRIDLGIVSETYLSVSNNSMDVSVYRKGLNKCHIEVFGQPKLDHMNIQLLDVIEVADLKSIGSQRRLCSIIDDSIKFFLLRGYQGSEDIWTINRSSGAVEIIFSEKHHFRGKASSFLGTITRPFRSDKAVKQKTKTYDGSPVSNGSTAVDRGSDSFMFVTHIYIRDFDPDFSTAIVALSDGTLLSRRILTHPGLTTDVKVKVNRSRQSMVWVHLLTEAGSRDSTNRRSSNSDRIVESTVNNMDTFTFRSTSLSSQDGDMKWRRLMMCCSDSNTVKLLCVDKLKTRSKFKPRQWFARHSNPRSPAFDLVLIKEAGMSFRDSVLVCWMRLANNTFIVLGVPNLEILFSVRSLGDEVILSNPENISMWIHFCNNNRSTITITESQHDDNNIYNRLHVTNFN